MVVIIVMEYISKNIEKSNYKCQTNYKIWFSFLELEQSYKSCGWRLKVLTETAASDQYGTTEFFSDNDFNNLEWGGSILGPNVMVPISNAKKSKNSEVKKKLNNRCKSKNPLAF